MTQAKMETAAERYRRIKAEKEKGEPLHDVECECGMVWKCRKATLDFWITSGILPVHLAEMMLESAKKTGVAKPEDLVKHLAPREVAQSIEFSAKVVKHTAREPRIVETATQPDEISHEEMMTCCFKSLLEWQMKGGDEAARLGNFPQQ